MDYNMMPRKEDDYDGINNNNNGATNSSYNSSDLVNNNNCNNSNSGMSDMQNSSGMSKAELRKSNKPIMEKRRRARINHCLNELKTLILEAMKKDPARHTKLEKADILEMTVKHLQSIQRHQLSLAIQTDPTVIHRFKTGFTECAEEVNRYIAQLDGVEPSVRQRLANHLNNCATGLEQIGTFSNFSSGYRTNSATISLGNQFTNTNPTIFPLHQDVNNNSGNNGGITGAGGIGASGRIQMGGVQLIPSRLPSGELALIMPNSNTIPFFLPNIQTPNLDFSSTFPRMSAFSRPTSSTMNQQHQQQQRPLVTQTITVGVNATTTTTTSTTQSTTTTTTTAATTTSSTSPPLSPVSSIFSFGEDSSMHTSSDFISKTPPLSGNQSFSNAFPTPPSAESIKFISHTGHLQQPHVSSTSESHHHHQQVKIQNENFTKKRLRPGDDEDNDDDDDDYEDHKDNNNDAVVVDENEPSRKLFKFENPDDKNGNLTATSGGEQNSTEGSNDMWRPW